MKNDRGGKHQKKKKNINIYNRSLTTKHADQEYGRVLKKLGNCRFEVMCDNGQTYLAHIRGKMKRREWVEVDDIVLISLRDFQNNKVDIILKYNHDEAMELQSMNEFDLSLLKNNKYYNDTDTDEDNTFIFEQI
jgi:translation initiation factor 1A